jgi:hypothetical protein
MRRFLNKLLHDFRTISTARGAILPRRWSVQVHKQSGEKIMRSPVEFLPRHVLYDGLSRCDTAPLGQPVRADMERRFGASFADVRVRTGPAASALCRKLGARALTLGRDIVFGEGQYAPDTADGRRLLAHELVHVLQQRGTSPRLQSPRVAVGCPRDACESEADRLATEALDSGLRSIVTPDAAGAIRRAVFFDKNGSGAKIKADISGAQPDVNITAINPADRVWYAQFYLTGVDPFKSDSDYCVERGTCTPYESRAIELTGEVLVTADSKEEIRSNWSFHFTQFFSLLHCSAYFAGAKREHGCIEEELALPPLMPAGWVPDFDQKGNPFVDNLANAQPAAELAAIRPGPAPGLWFVNLTTFDHPNLVMNMIRDNFKTREENYLYLWKQDYVVVTVLVAVNKTTKEVVPLDYVNWGASFRAQFRWNSYAGTRPSPKIFPKIDRQAFYYTDMPVGDADDATVARLSKTMFDPRDVYNKLIKDALKAVYNTEVNTPNFRAIDKWSSTVPKDLISEVP